jgi:hypothetical protein
VRQTKATLEVSDLSSLLCVTLFVVIG